MLTHTVQKGRNNSRTRSGYLVTLIHLLQRHPPPVDELLGASQSERDYEDERPYPSPEAKLPSSGLRYFTTLSVTIIYFKLSFHLPIPSRRLSFHRLSGRPTFLLPSSCQFLTFGTLLKNPILRCEYVACFCNL
jgi:hypothetical protein